MYVADDYANTNCVSLTSWVTSNGITATTFSNSAIDMTDYGSAGMPKIVVLGGGTAHTVFFNQNNSAAGNATALQSAIDSALVTSINEAAGSLQDFTIAPNPVDEGTTVKLNMNRSAEITIDVYNQSGQVVLNVFGGAIAPGESSVVINTAELAEGIYFVQIGEAEKCSVQKMVVTHKVINDSALVFINSNMMKVNRRILTVTFGVVIFGTEVFAQCCGGGSGSPIAGGASQGVLQDRQVEINTNFQYVNTNRFYKYDSRDTAFYFDSYHTQYVYTRLAYGVTKDFTMSVETGYWLNKTQVGLFKSDTLKSSGIGDIILFPRYDLINRTGENKQVELTVGLGFKIPVGSYNDSVGGLSHFQETPIT